MNDPNISHQPVPQQQPAPQPPVYQQPGYPQGSYPSGYYMPPVNPLFANGWIGILKIVTLVGLAFSIIGSIVMAIQVGNMDSFLGIFVFLIGLIGSIVTTSAVMVFLEMATDIALIRKKLEGKQ